MFIKNNLKNFFDEDFNKQKERVLMIDGHNLAYRNLHIAFNSAPDDTELMYWKHLMLNSFLRMIKRFEPNQCIYCIDDKYSWRKKIYKEYKSHRKEARKKSSIDFNKFYEILNTFMSDIKKSFTNIYFLQLPGVEADDIIAVLSKETFKGSEVTIVSNDQDYYQLLENKYIKIYNPLKKKYVNCLNPRASLELKIISGDVSDNIKGIIPRCGPKTAQKIYNKGVDALIKEHNQGQKIKKNYELNKKLIDFNFIPNDVKQEIKESFESYGIEKVNGRKLWEFMLKNNLKKLSEELQIYMPFIKNIK